MKKYTLKEFTRDFPDDNACLHHIFKMRYTGLVCPKCDSDKEFSRVANRRSYQCPCCGFQLYPTAATPFHRTRTPLTQWFMLIFLQTTTRNGVAAKEVERMFSVTYETALRMCHQVKKLIGNRKPGITDGIVEIDETYLGQKFATMNKKKRAEMINADNTVKDNKTGVMGFVSRDGKVIAKVMFPGKSFKDHVRENVSTDAIVVTDSHLGYVGLDVEYAGHESVNHAANQYKRDEWHTNTIENFWSNLKRTIKGTHIHVSLEYLQLYVDEISFRYMHRDKQDQMFNIILSQVLSA